MSQATSTRRRAGTPPRGRQALSDADATLTEQAYRAIEEAIVTLDLAPGEVVSEAQLSTRLGYGRTPVREALQRLARERLVRILPRRGIVVAAVDVAEQLRLLEVRREIERLIARAAARRADPEQRAAFREIAEGMEEAAASNDETGFLRLDRALNLLVLEAARNEFAAAAMALMHGLARRFWFIHWRRAAGLPQAAAVHAALARAIAAGEAEQAAAASDALLDYIEAFTRATLAPER
ncbi:GntR family transcriptional regulator [Paracraurococcus lichenis]|uniref:GntR family transcriptional regulator n=1 Tax=Paracraurococcus lichenis TaxID=3064888 RepID=A0ABT9E4V4_9PROT|nr:GntR family transcriptional regulator [Paracraurococcus sp. LOR1-02]MDO9711197.1 GntR family transcriptional regulator [Paracraurococcus sp. LOR1-02]